MISTRAMSFATNLRKILRQFLRDTGLFAVDALPSPETVGKINAAFASARQVPIGEVVSGETAKIVGQVESSGKTIRAPLSYRECVLYVAIAERYTGTHWKVIAKEQRSVDFTVEDETGRALVDRGAFAPFLEADHRSEPVWPTKTKAQKAFLTHHLVFGETETPHRYKEGILELGEQVAVYGSAVREVDSRGASRTGDVYRVNAATRLRFPNTPRKPVLVTDLKDLT